MKTIFLTSMIILTGVFLGCSADDEPNRAGISVKAIDDDDNSLIAGAKYRLTIGGRVIGEYVAGDGTIEMPSLPYGDCVIEEVSPPYGYWPAMPARYALHLGEKMLYEVVFRNRSNVKEVTSAARVEVSFWDTYQQRVLGDYTAVRIGEYYWINHNFRHSVPWGTDFENAYPMTQRILDIYLGRARLDKSQYQLANIADFDYQYGRYYSRPSLDYMHRNGQIYLRGGSLFPGWGFPTSADYEQLFAMCPFNTTHNAPPHTRLNQFDVWFALAPRGGSSSLAFDIKDPTGGPYKTYWFDNKYVTAIYDFNLMPGGLRLNGPSVICNLYGPDGGCYPDGAKGDIYGLFYVAALAVRNSNNTYGGVGVHDWLYTDAVDLYHLMNVRWCKPLTAKELGYRLYINNEKADIQKLDLNDPVPSGYSELPHGYLRGFYVQYIMDKRGTNISVADIVRYEKDVRRVYY